MTKEIILTRGKTALVDDSDYPYLSQFKWHCTHYGYAVRFLGRKVVWMHRLILNAPTSLTVDHINRNKLDNRRANLRLATHAENCRNVLKTRANTTGVQGVGFHKRSGKWRAYIRIGYRQIERLCPSFDEAVAVRKQLEQRYFGTFAAA